ncbi:hypothetical protein Vadar_030012 [Vaccinium darrowii]|uniref:Uncharacterized protein n=1 Tax=Vaccinium darrowii TaxID=229202 RepID=A0ACB7X552_9ERIC|nr:hypothetical protein Vadar_030012 [Vaccinium darrowii]
MKRVRVLKGILSVSMENDMLTVKGDGAMDKVMVVKKWKKRSKLKLKLKLNEETLTVGLSNQILLTMRRKLSTLAKLKIRLVNHMREKTWILIFKGENSRSSVELSKRASEHNPGFLLVGSQSGTEEDPFRLLVIDRTIVKPRNKRTRYASIRAIENNSSSEMRNLVAYWILFSLVSLFELAFAKLSQWLPFWSYMKLTAMCLLVLPDFNGASYVYECLLRPCLYVDLRVVMKYFIRPKEDKSLNAENFLSMAERYVQENGSEALEKLLDRKSKHTKPEIGVEEIKAMTNTEEKETAAAIQSKHAKPDIGMEEMKAMTNTEEKETPVAIQSKYEEPIVGEVDARAVEPPEKTPVAATKLFPVKEPSVGKENANMGQLKDENPAVATEQVKRVEPNLAQNEKKTVDAGEIKEKTVGAAGGENKAVETTGLEKIHREWTCALCQVRTHARRTCILIFKGEDTRTSVKS